MLQQLTLPRAFLLSTAAVMAFTAGAVYQFETSPGRMLEGLVPAWIGIGAVFWALWRVVARHLQSGNRS